MALLSKRIQIRLRDAHYAVTPLWEPTNIATQRRKERREENQRQNEEVRISCIHSISNTDPSGETNPNKFLSHPPLCAAPDLNPATNGA